MNLRQSRGLTLLELVVAMALFALVSVMSLQLVSGMMRNRDRLDDMAQRAQKIAITSSLLRQDLADIVPFSVPATGATDPANAAIAMPSDNQLLFSVGGQPRGADNTGQFVQRVAWGWDAGTEVLTRGSWPSTDPDAAARPQVTVLTGVTGFAVEVLTEEEGWIAGVPPNALGGLNNLPRAIRIELAGPSFETLSYLVVVR